MGLSLKNNSVDNCSRFKILADCVSSIAAKSGISIKGYHSPDLPLFSSLNENYQTNAIYQLETYLTSLELAEIKNSKSGNQERELWAALCTWGLVQPSEMFSFFSPDDVIEIYTIEGIQIWRNFNFMKICSYTLEEVYSIEWFKRYERSAEKVKECQDKVGKLLSGKTPAIYMVEVDEHIVQETLSVERFVLSLKHRWVARLNNTSGQLAAWIVSSKVNVIGKNISPFKERPELSRAPAPLHLA